jgi:hypothetical protein
VLRIVEDVTIPRSQRAIFARFPWRNTTSDTLFRGDTNYNPAFPQRIIAFALSETAVKIMMANPLEA